MIMAYLLHLLLCIERRTTHSTYLVTFVVDYSTIMTVHGMGGCNSALHRARLNAIAINCLPDILVQGIAVDASREWEEQQRRPPHRSDQAAAKSRIIEPVCLTGGNADTVRGAGYAHSNTIADAPAAVTQKPDLYKYLVALTDFLRYGASISLVKHANNHTIATEYRLNSLVYVVCLMLLNEVILLLGSMSVYISGLSTTAIPSSR